MPPRGRVARTRAPPLRSRGPRAWGAAPASVKRLHVHSIADASALIYIRHLRTFLLWAVSMGRENDTDFDELLSCYFEFACYTLGQHVTVGATAYAALKWLEPALVLPHAKRSLVGWERLGQRTEKHGVSEEIIGLVVMTLLSLGHIEAAELVALAFDAYPRLVELRSMRVQDVYCARVGDDFHVALSLGPRLRGESTKTGSDQGVRVDRPWVQALLMRRLKRRVAADRVFPSFGGKKGYARFLTIWAQATAAAGVSWIGGPHVLRHSGASNDLLHSRRTLKEVQLRGRWKVLDSVRRYGKTHFLVQSNARLEEAVLQRGRRFWDDPLSFFICR